ncbi:MAG: cyclopropane-fatty-acyl-phospholipid synthase family protein [Hyphomicrobium sp.]|uniref:class I SAM-dependent methyltransferase n=1 Tax=Hyphomicrobium sp. TaxID=82 RepID=UPI0039E40322
MSEWLLRIVASRLITDGHLEIAFPSGRFAMFGNGTGEPVYFRLTDRKAVWRLALHPSLALGELITDGRLQMLHGSIYDLLDLVCRNFAINALPSHSWQNILRRHIASVVHRRNSSRRARKNVAHHYDLNAALYQLFLDEDQQYSCAYFSTPDGDLDHAQLKKKRHIAAKLLPFPNHKVLDIGCGWGGLAIYLAKCCATFVTGITLSKEQLEVAKARANLDGLQGQVEFRLQDYRDVNGLFDRIVSIGMFEHVGLLDYQRFFASICRLLDDDGVMLLHTIGRLDGPAPTNSWLEKYIFPGSYAPALSEMLPAIERSGLLVTDVEVLRLHYAQTLRAWRLRFMENRDTALKLFDERFCRMWEFYLAGCEASFRYCGLVVFQLQLAKRIASVPQTRDYIVRAEDALTRAEEREHLALPGAAE